MLTFKNILSRILYLLIIAVVSIASVHAEIVPQKEAKRIARLFFNDAYSQICNEPEYVYNGKRLTTDRLFTPFYVFNSPEGGFVIISAENKAFPILGYSLMPKGMGFPKDQLTESDRQLLIGFSRDIELIRFDERYPSEAASEWEDIPGTIHSILYSPSLPAEGFERYRPDNSKMWVVRNRAVEFPYEWPKTDEELRKEQEAVKTEEYIPFSFYDNFIAETTREQERRIAEIEERLNPSKPIVRSLGGAHFQIDLPYGVELADIYNAEGQLMKRRYFRGIKSVPLDLSELPNGFYFGMLRMTDGTTFGVKLYR